MHLLDSNVMFSSRARWQSAPVAAQRKKILGGGDVIVPSVVVFSTCYMR